MGEGMIPAESRMREICCVPDYVAESLERPVMPEKSPFGRNIIF